jgi:nucleoside-diphosphate-sugar epimerase
MKTKLTKKTNIFLAGASRGVGREIAARLIKENCRITALLRSQESRPEMEKMGIKVAIADALDRASLEDVMLKDREIDAVISTIGGLSRATIPRSNNVALASSKRGQRADYLGNKNLIDLAIAAGVRKFILISSIGSGDSVVALPPSTLETLKTALTEKEKAEQHLIASNLTYTIIRPGGLKSEPPTGNGILTENYRVSGIIHRADVASLACRCLFSESANNKILSAIDRNMMYSQVEVAEFKLD